MTGPTSIPTQVMELFEELNFISSVEKGQKICFKKRYYVPAESWMGAFYRFMDGETGFGGATHISRVTTILVQTIEGSKGAVYAAPLMENAIAFRKALMRISSTYDDDAKVVAILKTCSIELDLKIPTEMKIQYGLPLRDAENHSLSGVDEDPSKLPSPPTEIHLLAVDDQPHPPPPPPPPPPPKKV